MSSFDLYLLFVLYSSSCWSVVSTGIFNDLLNGVFSPVEWMTMIVMVGWVCTVWFVFFVFHSSFSCFFVFKRLSYERSNVLFISNIRKRFYAVCTKFWSKHKILGFCWIVIVRIFVEVFELLIERIPPPYS